MSTIEKLKARITAADTELQPMRTQRAKVVAVTAGELRAVCDANPTHCLTESKRKSVAKFPDEYKVYVEQIDLLAMIDDAEVVMEETIEGDQRVVRKSLKPKAGKPLPAPKPAANPAEPTPVKKD